MLLHRPAEVAPWFWRASLTTGIIAMSIVGVSSQDGRPGRVAGQSTTNPDYDRVFAMDRVHELRIHIPAERFREMQADLSTLARGRGGRAFGPGLMPGPPPDGLVGAAALQEAVMACSGKAADGECSIRGAAGRCMRGPGDSLMCVSPQGPMRGFLPGGGPWFKVPEPIAVRVSVQSSGRTWTNVRMRYKGNSSLDGGNGDGERQGAVPPGVRAERSGGGNEPDLLRVPQAHVLVQLRRRFAAPRGPRHRGAPRSRGAGGARRLLSRVRRYR